jgi:outer membrane lipoprotein-sorting protein
MKHFFFTLGVLASLTTFSQSSKEILDKVSTKAKSWSTTSSDFTSTLTNSKTGKTTKQEGTVKVKGKQYQLNLPDYKVFCDGNTVWTYNKKSNSCSIDNLADVKVALSIHLKCTPFGTKTSNTT